MNRSLFSIFALAIAAAVPQNAHADILRVGHQADCPYRTLQAAIDAAAANGPGEDEIRLVADEFTLQRVAIADQSLIVAGGWSGCAENATRTGRSALLGGFEAGAAGINAVVRIQASGEMRNVSLRHLELRDGTGGPDGHGGGIDAGGTLRLVLEDVDVLDNHAEGDGGGIVMRGPANGFGGILELHAGVRVLNNSATGRGGGLFLERATARIRADRTEIASNRATLGGGIAAFASSITIGSIGEPEIQRDATGSRIVLNRADKGGGVYLDTGSLFDVHELQLSWNVAETIGGGLYAIGGSQLQMQRDYPNAFAVQCQGSACSRVEGNQAGNGCPGTRGEGAGLALDGGARAYVRQTSIIANCSWGSPAIQSWGPLLELDGVVVADNRLRWRDGISYTGRYAVSYASRVGGPASTARTRFSTFARNVQVKDDGSTVPADATSGLYTGGAWQFEAAAIATMDPFPGLNSGTGACSRTGLDATAFVDVTSGDYRPRTNGPLVDACAPTATTVEYLDPLLAPRCIDHPRPDQGGTCDIGAYELQPPAVPSDRVFAHGFE